MLHPHGQRSDKLAGLVFLARDCDGLDSLRAWARLAAFVLPNAGAILTLPAALYLSATPRFQFVGFVPVACLFLAAYTVRRDYGSYAVPWNRVRIGWGVLAGAALFWIILAVLVMV